MMLLLRFLSTCCSVALAVYIVPRPNGPFGVNLGVAGLTDTTRLDPFAPHPENRSTVITAFYPVAPADQCKWELVSAYPNATAAIFDSEVAFAGVPNGSFEQVRLEICTTRNDTRDEHDTTPVVFFSGGLGLSRLWYSAIAQAVASHGYTVVTVDHPYDADVVEFPDGRLITAINSTWDDAQSEQDVDVRVQDVSFVLDELSKAPVVETIFGPGNAPRLDTRRAGIFGHSIGGATAAMAIFEDRRIVGGVNLDGGLYGPVISQGLQDALMLFGHKNNDTSQTWIDIWPHLNWKLNIEILNSTHTTFTDIPLLADLILGVPLPPFVQGIVGGIGGERAREIAAVYVAAFMDLVLKCKAEGLLQRPSEDYPEIVFEADPGT